ncbi:uncharacterized protein H6S33_001817 [Morchella sextelata]|uniref:uncharacterized protein n=1 Tax=Morchella sextelata TaxID=1174677 RepID=UPI001D0553E9|nr:uncharacterized protein H6S33_001817 [Morchella sextelata]KAH0608683.1 hypothetical protein H6S33_001817 [Morchella sextelata]
MSSSNSPRCYDDSDSDMSTRDSSSSSRSTVPSSVPSLHYSSAESKFGSPSESYDNHPDYSHSNPRETVDTYCSTVASFDDFVEEDYPYYENGHHTYNAPKEPIQTQAIPAIPSEFAELFPSTRRLNIQHDDSTIDGNMNLRVDTNVASSGEAPKNLTLFHLRMYDLKARDFSLRRYGRDCGREVAHIKRKVVKPAPVRPKLQRSLSRAFESFRGKGEAEQFKLNRQDSGYSSSLDEEEDDHQAKESSSSTAGAHPTQASSVSNVCTLEFSNYAHVDLTRRGGKASKKYDFEYWGKSYSWKRVIIRSIGGGEEVHYHLVNNGTNNVVAYIVPDHLSPARAKAEEAKGGFVPPSSFIFRDSVQDPVIGCLADVADVIVATGLTALVDDCIKRKFHKKKTVHMVLPIPMVSSPLKMKMEYVGPRRLIDESKSDASKDKDRLNYIRRPSDDIERDA